MANKQLNFDIFDHPAVKRVSCWAILLEGEMQGKIIVAYPNDGAGIVKAQVHAFKGPLAASEYVMRGQAGGYGYCKTSAAICDALNRAGRCDARFDGRGEGEMVRYFEALGYQVISVL